MSRIPMVKCFVLKMGDDPINKECRYIPYNVFPLWKYYMENKHKLRILEEVESFLIDEEEYNKYLNIYERLELEEVKEIKIVLFSSKTLLNTPIVRYIEQENYEKIKPILLSHYVKRNKDILRYIQERRAFWINRKNSAQRASS